MNSKAIKGSQKILWFGILLIFIGVGGAFLKDVFDSIEIKKAISIVANILFMVGFGLGIVGMVKHWKAFFQSTK